MKVGDTVPVNIGSHVVAQAQVKELKDGTATLVVPATLVVMGTRTDLTDLPANEPLSEHVVLGAEDTQEATEKPTPQAVPEPTQVEQSSEKPAATPNETTEQSETPPPAETINND